MNKKTFRERKAKLYIDVKEGIDELEQNIAKYEDTGKVPIDGTFFDVEYVRKLAQFMHDVINNKEIDYQVISKKLIISELLASSGYWRKIRLDLMNLYLD